MSFFPVELEGSYWELGYKRGKVFKDLFRSAIETYLPLYKGSARKEHEKLTNRIIKDMEETLPELVEELRGITEGAGLPEEEVFMLNAWWENPLFPSSFPPNIGCSAVAFTDSKLDPIMGQTLDIGRNPYWVMVFVKPKKGYSFYGTLRMDMLGGGRCINEKGLCIGGTVSVSDRAEGLPRHVVLRLILESCATVDEAIDTLKEFKVSVRFGENLLLLDASGRAAVVEKSPTRQDIRWAEDGGICATNHFTLPSMRELNAGSEKMIERYSQPRLDRLREFIKEGDRERPIKAFKKILRSHGLGGLCYHGDEWPWPTCTQLANIMLPRQREMYVSVPMGPPCKSQFIKYSPYE